MCEDNNKLDLDEEESADLREGLGECNSMHMVPLVLVKKGTCQWLHRK